MSNNLNKRITFMVGASVHTRRLVEEVTDADTEIAAESQVGRLLLRASVGEHIVTGARGHQVIVKVLGIDEGDE